MVITYIETTDKYVKQLEKEVETLKKQNGFLMTRENKLQVLEMKEKEFINYLISLSNGYSKDGDGIKETIINELLQKFKEIVNGTETELKGMIK